ncbi:hypothetical protein LTR70_005691 [Exophiala xenobiotica]|uniref:Histone-lysine N-methyltransferase n=1 Tax=Lithohypha guttulata TaxID=1690604 RepID=A0ABR0KE32_9EURO|nr:hypothetical protein LTR24_004074 [Lithohypha guttulata]KAK5317686.1 hypothetical protein LTR70_005691 [Exophiala xenobiotica]
MPAVNSLISKFENITQQEVPASDTQRVRVKRYSMPLRQSTLSFGSSPAMAPKRHSMGGAPSKQAAQAQTPPAEEDDGDTIVVNTTAIETYVRVPLPTPSDSATDVSSQTSSTHAVKSPPRSRSKRVSTLRKSASKDTLKPSPAKAVHADKQRNISGETLVESATMSQTSLLKDGIDALNMTWNMSDVFDKQPVVEETEVHTDDGSTINVVVEEEPEEKKQHRQAKRVRMADSEKQWEQRREAADKNATRRSSKASILVSKASEVVSGITSSVLGKRGRGTALKIPEVTQPEPDRRTSTALEELQPDTKKARIGTARDEVSLAAAGRALRSRAPKDKKWLSSGLYAGQSRTFDPTLMEGKNKRKPASTANQEPSTASLPPKENFVLPLPMFAGDRLLETGRDFKLPFDIFSPLPTGQPKPDEWKKVNKNVFVGDAAAEWRTSKLLEHSTCMCKADTGCDADCLNRYMYYECDDRNCNLSEEQCGNRAFEGLRQRIKKGGKYNIGVEVIKTEDRGYGVRSNRTFEPNQIIVEYTGEIINQEECETRMHTMYKDNECYYLMAFDQNMIIDATRGSMARFVNHCCDPNCRMEKWTVGGKPRMALFAGDRGIMTGEELTYDYNFDPYSQKNVQVCRCGADNCRGVLGPKPKDLPKRDEKEGKLAGAKRKIAEVLEESTNLLNKKRKVNEPPKLPKGWAYIESEPKAKKEPKAKEAKQSASEDGGLSRQPSKLRRMLSHRSNKSAKSSASAKRRSGGRVVSTSSVAALIMNDDDKEEEQSERPATGLNSTAEGLRRLGRSLRGRS